MSPADFYIDLLSLDTTTPIREEESKLRVNYIIEHAQVCHLEEPQLQELVIVEPPQKPGRIRQTFLIAMRSLMNSQRCKSFWIGKSIQTILMAFAISIVWWKIDNDQSAIQDRLGLVFVTLLCSCLPAVDALLIRKSSWNCVLVLLIS